MRLDYSSTVEWGTADFGERLRKGKLYSRHMVPGRWLSSLPGTSPQQRMPDKNSLDLINTSNPRYTGWSMWIDSRGFVDERGNPDYDAYPYIDGNNWEALIYDPPGRDTLSRRLEFWRAEPVGRFYLYRGLRDDFAQGTSAPQPMTTLNFGLAILHTAQAIAVSMAFARAMNFLPAQTTLFYAFRWSELEGRELSAWATRRRFISEGYICRQDEVTSQVTVPLEASDSAIARFVQDATAPLFAAFGWSPGFRVVEDLTNRLLSRKL